MTTPEQDRARRAVEAGVEAQRLAVAWLAITSALVGVTMILTGAPAFLEDWFSPWSRVVFGLLAFAPGLFTLIGATLGTHSRCGYWAQVAGLVGQGVWYLAMMGVYIGLLFAEGPQWARLGEPLGANVSGRAYVPLIYWGLLGLAGIPLRVLYKLGPPPR